MSEENLYQNCCNECGIPIDSNEYGSYCPMHRLDMNGCCRNHCLLSGGEGESHCIHCAPTDYTSPRCGLCGRMINYHEDLYCDACIDSERICNLFATKIQRAWLKYRQRKRNGAIQIIQPKVIEWLYRPDGPMMKKSEKRFNQLIMSQK